MFALCQWEGESGLSWEVGCKGLDLFQLGRAKYEAFESLKLSLTPITALLLPAFPCISVLPAHFSKAPLFKEASEQNCAFQTVPRGSIWDCSSPGAGPGWLWAELWVLNPALRWWLCPLKGCAQFSPCSGLQFPLIALKTGDPTVWIIAVVVPFSCHLASLCLYCQKSWYFLTQHLNTQQCLVLG